MIQKAADRDKHVSLELKSEGYAKALAFLAAMRAAGPKVVIRELNGVLNAWQRAVTFHMPKDAGIAADSVQVHKAAQDSNGRIAGAVGTNVDYVKYLEFGGENAAPGLIREVSQWREGMDPIIHWHAKDFGNKDEGVVTMEGQLARARSEKRKAFLKRQIAKATASSREEFAPPFRGSWQKIEEAVIARLRTSLARLMKSGKVE
jgi:hypothetical protein